MDGKENEYKKLFLEESEEHLAVLNENLMAMEKGEKDKKLMDNIFRVAHTLKSSAAALGYDDLSALAHTAEDVMQKTRENGRNMDASLIDVFFEFIDSMKAYLNDLIEEKIPVVNLNGIREKFEKILRENAETEEKKGGNSQKESAPPCETVILELSEYEKKILRDARRDEKKAYTVTVIIDSREQIKWLRTELVLNKIHEMGQMVRLYPEKDEIMKPSYNGVFSVLLASSVSPDDIKNGIKADLIREVRIEEAKNACDGRVVITPLLPPGVVSGKDHRATRDYFSQNEQAELENQMKKSSYHVPTASETIRVPVNKLDMLMNLVGELVISNSGLRQVESRCRTTALENGLYSEINFITDKMIHIANELQNNVMNMRMVPVNNIFSQFGRVVRDLCKGQKKQVDLILSGEDTELDKKVVDTIGAPLTHLVRNAVDHGIESIEERIKKGKPAAGKITLCAYHEGNYIVISVKDDGSGVDLEKVKEKAVQSGLASREALENMDETDIMRLIFRHGFSTKDEVSSVSGRGVGLDVVDKAITGLGGRIHINSRKGEGTEFIMRLPLTVAVTASILVGIEKSIYAIPIVHIQECIKIKGEDIKNIDHHRAVRLRGEILPLIDVRQLLLEHQAEFSEKREYTVIVSRYQKEPVGLIVDRIIGEQEIVLKPLEKNYQPVRGISGAAILGDGKIVLVIDILSFIRLYRSVEESRYRKTA